ncbi:MAG: cation diffusion facilitator family transporter [Endomicrobiaceae bacterium]|jgi:cation diffusion facilitator family transporter|nr:cation diffusion facilitator family transporter [Endomicrobiaceae bacterium]
MNKNNAEYFNDCEKKNVALSSIIAAVFLTAAKIIVGVLTGSLGILSEALHSALDLIAAIITYFAVHFADQPADSSHHYGHGKVESLSALVETLLLVITCAWIIYEAISRLMTGKVHVEVTFWSYAVVILAIFIDFYRSRALMKAAKKHQSQALEADALHFSTDIWSSAVVLVGLICAQFGWYKADSFAALAVAIIVIGVSYRLGKKSIDTLLDKAPYEIIPKIENILKEFPEVLSYHSIKVRQSGADTFVELCIHFNPNLHISKVHAITENIECRICSNIKRCSVHIHQEPEDSCHI